MKKTKSQRKVAVVTGSRADYGLLVPVMDAIEQHPKLKLQVVVTGMHLLRRFGYTINDIKSRHRRIDATVRLQSEHDDAVEQSRGLGRAITGMTDAFVRLKSDIVVVLGERLEIFAAATAATASQLLLAHIHGGDAAVGVQDDSYRHAISKLSHIHLVASAGAKRRLLRLGEDSFRIYQTGSPALDNLSKNICNDINLLSAQVGFDVNEDFLLILQHPAGGSAAQECTRMLQTMRGCDGKGLKIIVLYPNCDVGFSGIIQASSQYCSRKGWPLLRHVPRDIYLGLLKRAKVLVGNSSSGIIESGGLNVDVVNVGLRQAGRERGSNVVDVDYGTQNVSRGIDAVLCRRTARRSPSRIYGTGRSGPAIASVWLV